MFLRLVLGLLACADPTYPVCETDRVVDTNAAFQAWADGGAPEGDPAAYVAPDLPATGLPRVDVSLAMAEPYTPAPPAGAIDDTRCFLLDWPETETKYVTGLAVNLGVASQVHHALLLIAGPSSVPQLEATDALDDGPGWSCPGPASASSRSTPGPTTGRATTSSRTPWISPSGSPSGSSVTGTTRRPISAS